MNTPPDNLANLSSNRRSLARMALMLLAGLMTLGAPQLSSGTTSPTPAVQAVLPPTPPGTEPGTQLFLQATVTGSGSAGLTFYLGATPIYDGHDVAIGSTTASSGTVGVAGLVPLDVAPGFYYLLACIGSNCVASPGTIHIIGQALSAVDQDFDAAIVAGPPGPEYFPESTRGMTVGDPFPCPISAHGQYPSKCVWVTTQVMTSGLMFQALWYCPINNPYPYQVAIGFDPLWEDRSYGYLMGTRPVSITKYQTDLFGPFSYSGGSGNRGYALFTWTSKERVPRAKIQVAYLCTDRRSNGAYP
jgi:hypothetical protein